MYIKEQITNTIQDDGFGSQFQNIISTIVYAEQKDKKFVYTPISSMEHNYNFDDEFIQKKELMINLIGNFDISVTNEEIPNESCKNYFDNNIKKCSKSSALNHIKKLFRENKKYSDYFDDNFLNIAIHIRRPNQDDNRILGANIPNSYFLNIINKLRLTYATMNPKFHIYSQGDIKNFKVFNAEDTVLHIDESIESTFSSMVFADVLVTCASSFSYTAGLLSNNIVYYIPFWHKPLKHWIILKKPKVLK